MSSTTEQAASLADMFPGVEFDEIVKILEREGFEGAIGHFLAVECQSPSRGGRQEEVQEACEMNQQLDAENERQRNAQNPPANIFKLTGELLARVLGAPVPAPTQPMETQHPSSPSTSEQRPQVHDIEGASSEAGLAQPPQQPEVEQPEVASPTAMSTGSVASSQLTSEKLLQAVENTRQALEGVSAKEFIEYKKKLDALAPQSTTIAIIGKPSVGKTSLINAMLGKPLLPTKPAGVLYTVKNQPGEETWYSVNGTQVPLEEKPFKLKALMEAVVGGLGGAEVEVRGPKMFPEDMQIREFPMGAAIDSNSVGVVVVNGTTQEDMAGYKDKPNVVVVAIGEDVEGALRVDPKMYLSTMLLQSVGAAGPYTGSFNVLRAKVNAMRAVIKEARDDTSANLLSEISSHTTQRITELLSIQHACGGDSVESRPPLSSEVPLTEEANPYIPARDEYQPPEPYTPATSEYVPEVSTWQPKEE